MSLDFSEDIQLVCKTGEIFSVDKSIAVQSEFISNTMACDQTATEFSLDVDAKQMEQAINYMKYHHNNPSKDIEKPLTKPLEELVDKWDMDFVDSMGNDDLLTLTPIANYLNIRPLLELLCAKLATLLKAEKITLNKSF